MSIENNYLKAQLYTPKKRKRIRAVSSQVTLHKRPKIGLAGRRRRPGGCSDFLPHQPTTSTCSPLLSSALPLGLVAVPGRGGGHGDERGVLPTEADPHHIVGVQVGSS